MPNKILLLGKYPPIQGGISSQVFWTCNNLATLGYRIDVVTNSCEVDILNRQYLFVDTDDPKLIHPDVSINQLSVFKDETIPVTDATLSRLIGLGLDLISKNKYDVIIGWYFEPYGMAASILGKIAQIPVLLIHAGSDIGRLSRHPNLIPSYKMMLENVSAVLTTKTQFGNPNNDLIKLNVDEAKCFPKGSSRLPEIYFSKANKFNVSNLNEYLDKWYADLNIIYHRAKDITVVNSKITPESIPRIGIIGKVGRVKGSFSLLKVLNNICETNLDFNFYSFVGGNKEIVKTYYDELLKSDLLSDRSKIYPYAASWEIPSVLQYLNIVCILENNFPIPFHNPILPREVLASGSCLLVSEEIAKKQIFYNSLVHKKNVLICKDPNDLHELSELILYALTNAEITRTIGKHGQYLSKFSEIEFFEKNGLENSIIDCINRII